MERLFALVIFIFFLPLLLVLYAAVKLTSKGPFIFRQKRVGKDKKSFIIYKIRTMVEDAENLKHKIKNQNEAEGPVFKIRHDPRYTKVGKFLSHMAIDEIPQLVNIIKGEMAFVGPRPLPIDEAAKVPKKYDKRFSVLPGMTSSWIVSGAHSLSFAKWMALDLEYVEKKSFFYDLKIVLMTVGLIVRLTLDKITNTK
jgi:lipopolysaccharide/colanic/teichoic acid biosynthesis glycosyltransferase